MSITTVYTGGQQKVEVETRQGDFQIHIPQHKDDLFEIAEYFDGRQESTVAVYPQEMQELIDGMLTAMGKYREKFGYGPSKI